MGDLTAVLALRWAQRARPPARRNAASGGVTIGTVSMVLATAACDAPPDGVWLVRLGALANAKPLLDTVARTLALCANASCNGQAWPRPHACRFW